MPFSAGSESVTLVFLIVGVGSTVRKLQYSTYFCSLNFASTHVVYARGLRLIHPRMYVYSAHGSKQVKEAPTDVIFHCFLSFCRPIWSIIMFQLDLWQIHKIIVPVNPSTTNLFSKKLIINIKNHHYLKTLARHCFCVKIYPPPSPPITSVKNVFPSPPPRWQPYVSVNFDPSLIIHFILSLNFSSLFYFAILSNATSTAYMCALLTCL